MHRNSIENFILIEEKIKWFYKIASVASLLNMTDVALGLWSIRGERPKTKRAD